MGEERGAKDQLHDLVSKADPQNLDEEVVAAMQSLLSKTPDLWRTYGELETLSLTAACFGEKQSVIRLSIEAGADELRKALGYADAPPLERLLIEQIVAAWVHWKLSILRHAQHALSSVQMTSAVQKWVDTAERRLQRAVMKLARLRKLGPKIQVNIAQQQVNVS